MGHLNEKQLITAAKQHDQKAFSLLFDLYWDVVYSSQLQLTKDENAAEEIALLTFTKAFDRIVQVRFPCPTIGQDNHAFPFRAAFKT